MYGVKWRAATEPLRFTRSFCQHSGAIREKNDGYIDASRRLHSVARAPKFENFREIEEIARENYTQPLYSFSFFPRILSPNFAVIRLSGEPHPLARLNPIAIKIENWNTRMSNRDQLHFFHSHSLLSPNARKIGEIFFSSQAAGSCPHPKIKTSFNAHTVVSHIARQSSCGTC